MKFLLKAWEEVIKQSSPYRDEECDEGREDDEQEMDVPTINYNLEQYVNYLEYTWLGKVIYLLCP